MIGLHCSQRSSICSTAAVSAAVTVSAHAVLFAIPVLGVGAAGGVVWRLPGVGWSIRLGPVLAGADDGKGRGRQVVGEGDASPRFRAQAPACQAWASGTKCYLAPRVTDFTPPRHVRRSGRSGGAVTNGGGCGSRCSRRPPGEPGPWWRMTTARRLTRQPRNRRSRAVTASVRRHARRTLGRGVSSNDGQCQSRGIIPGRRVLDRRTAAAGLRTMRSWATPASSVRLGPRIWTAKRERQSLRSASRRTRARSSTACSRTSPAEVDTCSAIETFNW